jgi:hypothetical protein
MDVDLVFSAVVQFTVQSLFLIPQHLANEHGLISYVMSDENCREGTFSTVLENF